MIKEKIIERLSKRIETLKGSREEHLKEIVETDNFIIIRLRGRIDAYSIPLMSEKRYEEEMEKVNKHILIDFKDVEHVDSATLAVLVTLFRDLKANHMKLGIINPTAHLEEYIKINKLSDIITVYSSEEEARKELAG